MKNRKKGFTLIELMVAALLAGVALLIALPFVLVGQNSHMRTEQKEAVSLAGEAIFEYVSDEMKYAGRIFIGDDTSKKPTFGDWKAISAEDAGEHPRLRYRSAKSAADPDLGAALYDESYQKRTDLVIEAEAVSRDQMTLTVKLMDGEEAVYEKTSTLTLLNLSLNATSQIEGYVGGKLSSRPEGETAPLVIWYQSTAETVNPFEDNEFETQPPGEWGSNPGDPVVSLANPQYVQVNGELAVQFQAKAGTEKEITGYSWSLGKNTDDDGKEYVSGNGLGTGTGNTVLPIVLTGGSNPTEADVPVRLGLTVRFSDGTERTVFCDIIVYGGDSPAGGKVGRFVIVPDGMEDSYLPVTMDNEPIWVRSNTEKQLWLEASDETGMNWMRYSANNWKNGYTGFGIKGNKNSDITFENGNLTTEKNGDLHNYVIIKAENMGTNPSDKHLNSIELTFGDNQTVYKPNGDKGKDTPLPVTRKVNLYDAAPLWWYATDKTVSDWTKVEKGADNSYTVSVASNDQRVQLQVELDVKTNLNPSDESPSGTVPEIYAPESSDQSDEHLIRWYLENGEELEDSRGSSTCSIQIGEEGTSKQYLKTGDNPVTVKFWDTVGTEYEEKITVRVPSKISYVEFDQPSYTMLYLGGTSVGEVTEREIGFKLYDENGNPIYEGTEEETVKDFYDLRWGYEYAAAPDKAFEVKGTTLEAKSEGSGKLTLTLVERATGNEVKGEDGEPCVCEVKVLPLELSLRVLYLDENGKKQSAAISSGKSVSVSGTQTGVITGVDAVVSPPKEFLQSASKTQLDNLTKTDYSKAAYEEQEGTDLPYQVERVWGSNKCTLKYIPKNKAGTMVFRATADIDSGLTGEFSISVYEDIVKSVTVQRVSDPEPAELVIGANAGKTQYNSVQLQAIVESQGGKSCDKNVIWTIQEGEELVDAEKLILNIDVDSEKKEMQPVIMLKKGLTEEDAKKEIVIRATSASNKNIYWDYSIKVLPQFRITAPYAQDLTLTHMSYKGKQRPESRMLTANRSADWSMTPGGPLTNLTFTSDTKGLSGVTVQTQTKAAPGDTGLYRISAVDAKTGQEDHRDVSVVFKTLMKNVDPAIELSPEGFQYMELGESALNYYLRITAKNEVFKENENVLVTGDSVKLIVDSGNLKTRTVIFRAVTPGLTEVRAQYVSGGRPVYSAAVTKYLVIGLTFDGVTPVNMNQGTVQMTQYLKNGDIGKLEWESSNETIAAVSSDGTVTLKNPGKTTISVWGVVDSNGKEYSTSCELTVTASGTGTVDTVLNGWSGTTSSEKAFLVGSEWYGAAEMTPNPKDGKLPVFYSVTSKPAGTKVIGIDGTTATAKNPGTATITAGVGATVTKDVLTAKVYQLKNIDITSSVSGGMLNLVTGSDHKLDLSANLNFNPVTGENVPKEFQTYAWSVDSKSSEIVDISVDERSGQCTVTAKGMGAAYVTCTSAANPNISETYVVIVSF